jgi:hypothetical protein
LTHSSRTSFDLSHCRLQISVLKLNIPNPSDTNLQLHNKVIVSSWILHLRRVRRR